MKTGHLLAYFGHHKAATTWVSNIVKNVCTTMGLRHSYVSNEKMFDFNLTEFVNERKVDFLIYSNAKFKQVEDLDSLRGFHIIRDPRDLIVSAYFSHLYSHSTHNWRDLTDHREKLEKLPKNEGLLLEMEFCRRFLEDMYNWKYDSSNILELKMEDVISNPYKKFLEIFKHLRILDESGFGLKATIPYFLPTLTNSLYKKRLVPLRTPLDKIPAEKLLGIIYKNDFSRKSGGRKTGEENLKNHYRKGMPGDWKNHFGEEHTRLFKENYNDVLIKLEYESSSAW